MNADRLPGILKYIWTELTRPPAMLHRRDHLDTHDQAHNSARVSLRPMAQSVRDLFDRESPTDEPDGPKLPGSTADEIARATQRYFVPRRTGPPAVKPRPRGWRRKARTRRAAGKPRSKRRRRASPATGAAGASGMKAGSAAGTAGTASSAGATGTGAGSAGSAGSAPGRAGAASSAGTGGRPNASAPPKSPVDRPSSQRLGSEFGHAIQSVQAVDGIWRIVTDAGRAYAVKATRVSTGRIHFMADAIDAVHRRGFPHAARILRTGTGDPFVRIDGVLYYASEWMPGRRASFRTTREIGAMARSLARFHEASLGNSSVSTPGPPDVFGIGQLLAERQRELALVAEQLSQRPGHDAFDALTAEHAPAALAAGDAALTLIQQPEVRSHLQESELRPGLCHLDVTRRNLITHPTGFVQLIDFDLMTYGPRTLDLAHLIRRVMQAHGTWENELALAPLLAYNRVRPLLHGEYLLLEALLTYPHRFWRLVRGHYQPSASGAGTEEQEFALLQRTVEQEPARTAFLDNFAANVTRRARDEL